MITAPAEFGTGATSPRPELSQGRLLRADRGARRGIHRIGQHAGWPEPPRVDRAAAELGLPLPDLDPDHRRLRREQGGRARGHDRLRQGSPRGGCQRPRWVDRRGWPEPVGGPDRQLQPARSARQLESPAARVAQLREERRLRDIHLARHRRRARPHRRSDVRGSQQGAPGRVHDGDRGAVGFRARKHRQGPPGGLPARVRVRLDLRLAGWTQPERGGDGGDRRRRPLFLHGLRSPGQREVEGGHRQVPRARGPGPIPIQHDGHCRCGRAGGGHPSRCS